MRFLSTLLIALVAMNPVLAADFVTGVDKLKTGKATSGNNKVIEFDAGLGAANPKLRANVGTGKVEVAHNGVTFATLGAGGSGGGASVNLYTSDDNFGFEDGTTSWSASGGSFTIDSSTPLFDSKSALFDASGSGQYLAGPTKTIPRGLDHAPCALMIGYKYASGSDGDYQLKLWNGSAYIGQTTDLKVDTTGDTQTALAGFECIAGTTVTPRVVSNVSNPPVIKVDGAKQASGHIHLGSNPLLYDVGGASIYGTLTYPQATSPNCQGWTVTQATYAADFPTDATCNAAVVTGGVSAPGSKVPQWVMNNAPPAFYIFNLTSTVVTGTGLNGCRVIDESNNVIAEQGYTTSSGVNAISLEGFHLYSSAGNHTFKLQCASTGTTMTIRDDTGAFGSFYVTVKSFPLSSTTAIAGTDATGQSYSGYMTGTWTLTGTTDYADFGSGSSVVLTTRDSRNFGGVTPAAGGLPGITWTPTKSSTRKWVCASGRVVSSAGTEFLPRLIDSNGYIPKSNQTMTLAGGNPDTYDFCGIFPITSASPYTVKLQAAVSGSGVTSTLHEDTNGTGTTAIEWNVFDVSEGLPTVALVKQLQSPSVVTMQHATAHIACEGGTCSVVQQDGSWVSVNPTPPATGDSDLTFSIFSATPNCSTSNQSNGGEVSICMPRKDGVTPSATALRVKCAIYTGVAADRDYVISCTGPK